MTETNPNTEETTNAEDTQETKADPWDDVIRDFQSLGDSIAKAVHDAINDERHKQPLHEMKEGMEKAADQVTKAIDDATKSEHAANLRANMQKAAEDAKQFSDKMAADTKPIIVTALETLNKGIEVVIDRLQDAADDVAEAADDVASATTAEASGSDTEATTPPQEA